MLVHTKSRLLWTEWDMWNKNDGDSYPIESGQAKMNQALGPWTGTGYFCGSSICCSWIFLYSSFNLSLGSSTSFRGLHKGKFNAK